ncbi:hypothetical protein CSB20_10295 [bacterium DOLZORAL124_64_63]|nr:MAG: hypothetical protein CSB20_10295 [bacterium DOLZORAL124_64_63]
MRIVSAAFSGFRNLENSTLEFSPRVNLVLGRNGMGKTNLFEALNYFALGRSHMGGKTDEMIHFDRSDLHVRLEVEEESGQRILCEFGLDRQGGRRFRIDGELITRRTDLVGRLATVVFNPESIQLVRGGPQNRRRFVDQGQAEIDPLYLSSLTAFQRTLKQKNGLLKDVRRGLVPRAIALDELRAWNKEMATHAAVICLGREQYTRQISPHAQASHRELTDSEKPFSLVYSPSLECAPKNIADGASKEDFSADIFAELDYIIQDEIRRGRPLAGPQLDDFEVRLAGLDLRVYGSQGETRTAAVSIILARGEALFEKRRIRPVLFFDDIFSELDRQRTRRLQEMASRLHQVYIASARLDDVEGWRPADRKAWRVKEGRFTAFTPETEPNL